MELSSKVEVKPFGAAEPGSLLVGRFSDQGPNFIAIRADWKNTSYLAILNPWIDDIKTPYLNKMDTISNALDLGKEWTFGVSVDETSPAFQADPNGILFRSRQGFFIKLTSREGFLDVSSGDVISCLPNDVQLAVWYEFTIHVPQPNTPGPGAKIMHWPNK